MLVTYLKSKIITGSRCLPFKYINIYTFIRNHAKFQNISGQVPHEIYFLFLCLHSAHCTIKWAIKFNYPHTHKYFSSRLQAAVTPNVTTPLPFITDSARIAGIAWQCLLLRPFPPPCAALGNFSLRFHLASLIIS